MNIHNTPYTADFLKELAGFVLKEFSESSFEYRANSIIILPTRNACRALTEILKYRLQINAILPKIVPISHVDDLTPVDMAEHFALIKVLKNRQKYASSGIRYLSKAAWSVAKGIEDLEMSSVSDDDARNESVSDILSARHALSSALSETILSAQCLRQYVESLTEFIRTKASLCIAADLTPSNPVERELAEAIASHPNGHTFVYGWHKNEHVASSAYYTSGEEVSTLGTVGVDESRSCTDRGTEHVFISMGNMDDPKTCSSRITQLITARDIFSEVQLAAFVAKETLIQNPSESVAILVTENGLAGPLRTALSQFGLHPEGPRETLLTSEFGRHMLATAQFLFGEMNTLNLLAVLDNTFFKMPPKDFQDFDLFIKFRKFIPADYRKVIAAFFRKHGSNDLLATLSQITQTKGKHDARTLFESHLKFLSDFSGRDIPFIDLFANELSELKRDIKTLGEIDAREYPEGLKIWLEQKRERKEYSQKQIRILAPKEAQLLKFDTVIFLGLNDDTFPGPLSSMIPGEIRQHLGLTYKQTHITQTFREFIEHTYAKHCFAIRHTSENGKMTIESRFIRALRKQGLIEENHYFQSLLNAARTPKKVRKLTRPAPKPDVSLRPTKLSVTEIGNLMRNPYFIYAKHVLGLRSLNEFNFDSLHSIKGQLIHKMLDIFIEQFSNDPNAHLSDVFDGAMAELMLEPKDLGFWLVKMEDMNEWFMGTIRKVRQRSKSSYSEINGEVQLDINGHTFSLICLADRIDWLNDDTISIVDYKTGSIPSMRNIIAGFSPQLYLEGAIAVQGGFLPELPRKISAIEIWRLNRSNNSEIVPIAKSPEKMVDLCFKGFQRVITKFFDPQTPYLAYPVPDITINADPYYQLARVDEWMF